MKPLLVITPTDHWFTILSRARALLRPSLPPDQLTALTRSVMLSGTWDGMVAILQTRLTIKLKDFGK